MTRRALSFWFALTLAWLVARPVNAEPTEAKGATGAKKNGGVQAPVDETLRQLDEQLRHQTAEARMGLAIRVVAGWALFLAVAVGCLRADEWTHGRHTRWWWAAGAALLVAAAVAMAWFL